MTFEEFKEQAVAPEYCNTSVIYMVEELCLKEPYKEALKCDQFWLTINRRLLYTDKNQAEEKMRQLITKQETNSPLYAVYIYELPTDKDISPEQFQRVWVYDRHGNLNGQSFATEIVDDINHPSAKFRGRESRSIRFKPGDIVEVYNTEYHYCKHGIVVKCPPSIEECYELRKQAVNDCETEGISQVYADDNYSLYAVDDCYEILTNSGYNMLNPRTWHVFPVSRPFPRRLREELQNHYKESLIRKSKNSAEGSCSFEELMEML